jgi:hypothetical protein
MPHWYRRSEVPALNAACSSQELLIDRRQQTVPCRSQWRENRPATRNAAGASAEDRWASRNKSHRQGQAESGHDEYRSRHGILL